jgi:rSAM/selenodomain-associated transferase 1
VSRPQLVVMARWPAPGRCKRRLALGVGARRAAAIQARLTAHTLAVAKLGWQPLGGEVVLAVSGLGSRAARHWAGSLGADRSVLQGAGSLGMRMGRQLRRAQCEGSRRIVLIGTDLPQLGAADLEAAFQALETQELVLGPSEDGGYWLIGLRRAQPLLFAGDQAAIGWGSARVLEQTLAIAQRQGLEVALLPRRRDLDRAADLEPWR